MQDIPHAHGGGIRQHDESQVGRGLVVVHAVLAGAIADEGIVFAAQLAHDIAQTKDGAKDEFGIVRGAGDLFRGGSVRGRSCFTGDRGWRGGLRGWKPVLGIDALRWVEGAFGLVMTQRLATRDWKTYCAGRRCKRSRLSWWAAYITSKWSS